MKSILMRITLISFLFVLFIPNLTSAELKTFVKEYIYQASDEDSKNSSRTIALREVKRLLLEELGTYLESVTEVQNFQLTKDQITTLTAGIVMTEVVDDKWDGRTYWLKAKITVDSAAVIKSIDTLRKDRVKTKELEEIRKHSDALLKENERLRKELLLAKGKNRPEAEAAYDKTIKELTAIELNKMGDVRSCRNCFKSFKAWHLTRSSRGEAYYEGGLEEMAAKERWKEAAIKLYFGDRPLSFIHANFRYPARSLCELCRHSPESLFCLCAAGSEI